MNQFFTYTVYHSESGKVVAKDLFEEVLVHLINKMIEEDIVKDIKMTDYMDNPFIALDTDSMMMDIESQGVFIFERKIHG